MSARLQWIGDETKCHRWRIQTTRERNGTKWETYYSLEVSESPIGGPRWRFAPGEGNKRTLRRRAQELMDGAPWDAIMSVKPGWLTTP